MFSVVVFFPLLSIFRSQSQNVELDISKLKCVQSHPVPKVPTDISDNFHANVNDVIINDDFHANVNNVIYQWWFLCQIVHKVEEPHDDPEHCGSSTLKLVHMFYINYMNTTVGHLNRVVFEELVMFIDPGKLSETIGTKSSFLVIILGVHESGQTPEEHLEPNLWLFNNNIVVE